MLLARFSSHFPSLSSLPTSTLCPSRCWFAGGWVCAHFRTLWVSPTYSPVRLSVSPAAKIPTDFFLKLWFWILICLYWNPGFQGPSRSPAFPQAYLHTNAGLPVRSSSCRLALPSPPCCLSAPLLLLVEYFFNSLAVGLLYKCFSGSSSCSLFLNRLFSFFWLCKEAKHFCLSPYWPPPSN